MSPRPVTLAPAIGLFALVALAALFIVSKATLWLLVALTVLILASYVLRLRLPTVWLPSLLFGGTLVGMAILSTPLEAPTAPAMIGTARATFLFGQAAAILMTIQFFRPNPTDPTRPGLFALLGGGVTLMSACNSFEERPLLFLLPAAVGVTGLALRALSQNTKATSPRNLLIITPALILGIGAGAFGIHLVKQNRDRLTEWGNRFMNDRPQPEPIGLSQQPTLGETFGGRGSNARALRLEGVLLLPHLRGAAYETYSDGRWWPPLNARSMVTLAPEFLNLSYPPRSAPNRIQVTRFQSADALVFFPLETAALELGEVDQMEWGQGASGPVRVRAESPYRYSYQEIQGGFQGLMARPGIQSEFTRQAHLQLTEELKEVLTPLALKITKDATTPQGKVQAVTDYLLKNYTYSLSFVPGFLPPRIQQVFSSGEAGFIRNRNQDMVARFLLAEPRRGAHCEYFASSAALLLRCVGVPTRYVTGYFAHEQEMANTTLVRQRDAHAWCEAWIDGKGWITVEATPPTGWPDQDKSSVELWRRIWESVEDTWQRALAWLADQEPAQLALLLMGPFGIIGLTALLQRLRRKPLPTLLDPLLPPPNLATYAQRFEALLPALSPAEPWSERLSALPEAAQPAAKRFVALYQKARFGGQNADSEALEEALKSIESMLAPKS